MCLQISEDPSRSPGTPPGDPSGGRDPPVENRCLSRTLAEADLYHYSKSTLRNRLTKMLGFKPNCNVPISASNALFCFVNQRRFVNQRFATVRFSTENLNNAATVGLLFEIISTPE